MYDGTDLLCELNATGSLQRLNTWGTNGLLSRGNTLTAQRYMFDPMGNVVNRPSGTTTSTDAGYDAFGTAYGNPSAPYGYGGQWGYYTDGSGLILCTHRYYDPQTRRWLTRDPIGYDGGINLYGYVDDDPVNDGDPMGLWRWPWSSPKPGPPPNWPSRPPSNIPGGPWTWDPKGGGGKPGSERPGKWWGDPSGEKGVQRPHCTWSEKEQ